MIQERMYPHKVCGSIELIDPYRTYCVNQDI
jgi:hypothetical protein